MFKWSVEKNKREFIVLTLLLVLLYTARFDLEYLGKTSLQLSGLSQVSVSLVVNAFLG